MNEDFESQLRAALQPVPPEEGFADRLAVRLAGEAARADGERRARSLRRRSAMTWWVSASLAASLVVGVAVQQYLRQQREMADGMKARSEVIQALWVTNQKLDLAMRVVKDESGG